MFGRKKHKGDKQESERDQYVSKMTTQLDDWDVEVDSLEKKSHQASTGVVEEHLERVRKLEEKIGKGRGKMKEIIGSTDEAWHSIKVGTDTVFQDIRTNLDKARKAYHDELEDD